VSLRTRVRACSCIHVSVYTVTFESLPKQLVLTRSHECLWWRERPRTRARERGRQGGIEGGGEGEREGGREERGRELCVCVCV